MTRLVRTDAVLGAVCTLHLADDLPRPILQKLADSVFGWMRGLEARFNVREADSEVCRLDRGELDPAGASEYVRDVLNACADAWRDTDGFFDICATGRLNPSRYVKAWATEHASARLAGAGSDNHLITIGGRDTRTRGGPGPGEYWQVPIAYPRADDGTCPTLATTDHGVSTCGLRERRPRVIDPTTSEMAEGLRSVTVVGGDLSLASAYATAAVAMGRSGLSWLAGLDGYEWLTVTEDGQVRRSTGLPVVASSVQVRTGWWSGAGVEEAAAEHGREAGRLQEDHLGSS